MLKKEATKIVGGLTSTTKLPCKSYGLPAAECKLGSILRNIKGTVCEGCYAFNKGSWLIYKKKIDIAEYRRLKNLNHPNWIKAMALLTKDNPYFRWHHSGDLQNLKHLMQIVIIAELNPKTKYWLPTRELKIVSRFKKAGFDFPNNLIIRISGTKVNGPAPKTDLPVSTVTTGKTYSCKAPDQDDECRSCRKCWNKNIKEISYKKH